MTCPFVHSPVDNAPHEEGLRHSGRIYSHYRAGTRSALSQSDQAGSPVVVFPPGQPDRAANSTSRAVSVSFTN